jgi:hypothetical protein
MIHLGGIEMAIADFGGFGDHMFGGRVIKLVCPKAKCGDFRTLPVPENHDVLPPSIGFV